MLVVDDDRSIRLIPKSLLTKAGYSYSEADNGREGLELARIEFPDMMIVDWMMPEMDGIELIRSLRQTECGHAIYILLLTGLDQEERLVEAFAEDRAKCLEAGMNDLLIKPFNPDELFAVLLRALNQRRGVTTLSPCDRKQCTEEQPLAMQLSKGRTQSVAALLSLPSNGPSWPRAEDRLDVANGR